MKNTIKKTAAILLSALCIITSAPTGAFAAEIQPPSNLTVSECGENEVELSWDENESVCSYDVYISTDAATYTMCTQTNSNSVYIENLSKGLYYFYVIAVEDEYNYDDEQTIITQTVSQPSNVVSAAVYDNSQVYCNAYFDEVVTVNWSDYAESEVGKYFDGYVVFVSENGGEYRQLANVAAGSFSSQDGNNYTYLYKTQISSPGTYSFAVCKYAQINGVFYCDYDYTQSYSVSVNMDAPVLTTKTKSEVIKWKKYDGVEAYEIWQECGSKTKKVATVSADKSSYTVKNVNNYKKDYNYTIKAIKNGTVAFVSDSAYSGDGEARFRAAKKLKKKKTSVNVINTRGKKNSTAWTSQLTKKDKKILASFAKKHFKKGWSNYKKATYTLEWINKKVKYASGGKYNNIAKCSYVEAIFSKKCGQCLQYNGAYAMMLTYLGYEARIIQGWRGTKKNKWSHYWCEIKIDGKWYLCETGNYQDSGSWSYFCETYRNAGGYLLNNKAAK